ncbi:hypothetical protein PR202_gb00055 [Eleusine coracana subsp. coracana]|uniref:Uncharacterized protein n=1 Tax=Eleusine coracana subsp. coracana TaxID=191504 RepID=A0AAV5DT22_ELECO|nr:hypothetical protein PR202_gb00055 [Eleusine coracana subsp. coracana]
MKSTAFRFDVDKDRENGYLVTHTNESRKYAWYQHSFKVVANVKAGVGYMPYGYPHTRLSR